MAGLLSGRSTLGKSMNYPCPCPYKAHAAEGVGRCLPDDHVVHNPRDLLVAAPELSKAKNTATAPLIGEKAVWGSAQCSIFFPRSVGGGGGAVGRGAAQERTGTKKVGRHLS